MALRLNGSSSGYVELDVPAAAGSHTLTLPDGGGTSGQYLQTNGSGALSWETVTSPTTNWVQGTSQNLNTLTTVTFTSIPSNVDSIVALLNQATVPSSNQPGIRVGTAADGVISTGYEVTTGHLGGGNSNYPSFSFQTNGFNFNGFANIQQNYTAVWELRRISSASNVWSARHSGVSPTNWNNWMTQSVGLISLGSALDRIQFYTTGGSAFGGGSANVSYITR